MHFPKVEIQSPGFFYKKNYRWLQFLLKFIPGLPSPWICIKRFTPVASYAMSFHKLARNLATWLVVPNPPQHSQATVATVALD